MLSEFEKRIVSVEIKTGTTGLLILAVLSLLILILNRVSVIREPLPERKEMIVAAGKMIDAVQEIRKFRKGKNIPIVPVLDPDGSGFIGQEFSVITTTLGELPAKQTALNPDFAALFIRWFRRIGLNRGEQVVIHASGSFPALSIAAIIAAENAGLEPVIFSSLGASAFGANHPDFTYWDIEYHLFKTGIIRHRTIFATPGGENDNGSSFWPGGMKIAGTAAVRNGIELIIPGDLQRSISLKYEHIKSLKRVGLFINIGGNQAALGKGPCVGQIPPGLITKKIGDTCDSPGLIHFMNQDSIPIIHMIDIKELALKNGISFKPDFKNDPGFTRLYFRQKRPLWLTVLSLVILTISIVIVWFGKNKKA